MEWMICFQLALILPTHCSTGNLPRLKITTSIPRWNYFPVHIPATFDPVALCRLEGNLESRPLVPRPDGTANMFRPLVLPWPQAACRGEPDHRRSWARGNGQVEMGKLEPTSQNGRTATAGIIKTL